MKPKDYIGKTFYHMSHGWIQGDFNISYKKITVKNFMYNKFLILIDEQYDLIWDDGEAELITTEEIERHYETSKTRALKRFRKLLSVKISSYKKHLKEEKIKLKPKEQDQLKTEEIYLNNIKTLTIKDMKKATNEYYKYFWKRCKYKIGDKVKFKDVPPFMIKDKGIIVSLAIDMFDHSRDTTQTRYCLKPIDKKKADWIIHLAREKEIISKI